MKRGFSKGSAASDVLTLTLGTVLAQGLTVASTVLLSRLYAPSDFGLLAVFLAVTSVAATLITLRYETSILVPKENAEAANIVLLSLALAAVGTVLLLTFGVFLPHSAQKLLGLAPLKNWLPLAFFVAGSMAVITTTQSWLNRNKEYRKMALLRILQSGFVAGLCVLFGYIPNIKSGLLLAQVAACFFTVAVALWLLRSAIRMAQSQQLLTTAQIHKNAPKYLLLTSLMDVATLQMPVLLIATWFGEGLAGQFSMAWRVVMLPMSLVGGAVGQVFLQKFSMIREDAERSRKFLKATWLILTGIGIVPMGLIFFFGEQIFSFVLGGAWVYAGTISSILAPMALIIFISSPTSGTYIILGIQRYSPLFGLASLIYRPICFYIGYQFNDINLGLKVWVVCEVIQITSYQMLAWKKIKTYKTS